MPKHGTASISLGLWAEFVSVVVRNLPRDLDREQVKGWVESTGQPDLRERLARAFAAPPTARLIKVLTVTCHGNATASQLRERGKYDWSSDLITDERFPIVAHDPWSRQIGLIELDHDWSWDQGLAALAAHDLEQPTAEDGLYLGIQHPEEQRERPIVFPHKPVQVPHGGAGVLVLHGGADYRLLDLHCCDDQWARRYLLAGVRKVA